MPPCGDIRPVRIHRDAKSPSSNFRSRMKSPCSVDYPTRQIDHEETYIVGEDIEKATQIRSDIAGSQDIPERIFPGCDNLSSWSESTDMNLSFRGIDIRDGSEKSLSRPIKRSIAVMNLAAMDCSSGDEKRDTIQYSPKRRMLSGKRILKFSHAKEEK